MVSIKDLKKDNEYEWVIPREHNKKMRVPVRLFMSRNMLENAFQDKSIEQAINAACLPGLRDEIKVMPDMHQGYGFPIGGVGATEYPGGVISPGGIGYDINCGVRLLASQIPLEAAEPHLKVLIEEIYRRCPSGVGSKGGMHLSPKELEQVCQSGARWLQKRGMATDMDLRRTESQGELEGAEASALSNRAQQRGIPQLGTLGSGNHFLEVGVVDQVFHARAASVMGLSEGMLTMMIHSGSRGLGHQVCTDFVQKFQGAVQRYGIELPDRELVCAPLDSPEGRDYLAAMRAAANYAFANRQLLAHNVREAFESILAGRIANWHLHQVYDITHNMGNIETHDIDGKKVKVCVHRKGATRAFGPGSPGLPEEFAEIGQPVLVPGSMGTASWVLVGTAYSMQRSLGSSCHGAGRVLSRHQAKRQVRGDQLRLDLEQQGIHVRAGSMSGLAEEAPLAYKDIDQVIEVVAGSGIALKVARLRPLAVVKG